VSDTSQREYWSAVRTIARDAFVESVESAGDVEPVEYIDGQVDGNSWVIYTHAAAATCMHSENEDAYFEDNGEITSDSFCSLMTTLAYWAMRADVWAHYQGNESEWSAWPDGVEIGDAPSNDTDTDVYLWRMESVEDGGEEVEHGPFDTEEQAIQHARRTLGLAPYGGAE